MIYIRQLDNGMRIVGEQIDHFRSVSVGIWIGTGSRHEQKHENGISHFIEHMFFKGTQSRSAQDIAVEMDSIGGQINAFTSKECTCYYVKVMDEHLEKAIDILCDILLYSKLAPEEIEREKGVVLEEINMVQDTPEDLAHETASSLLFGRHPLARPVLGTAKLVQSFDQGMLQNYIQKRYTSDNIVVSIAGRYDRLAFERMIMDKLSHLLKNEKTEPRAPKGQDIKPRFKAKAKRIEQVHLCLCFPGVSQMEDDLFTMNILSSLLGGSISSRLFQTIREQMGLAYSVYSHPVAYRDCGMLSIYAGMKPTQTAQVLSLILQEIDKIRNEGISEKELQQGKEQFKGNYILGLENASSRMSAMGRSLLMRDEVWSEDQVLEKASRVTREQVKQMAMDVMDRAKMTTVVVGKATDKKQIEEMVSV